MTEDASATNHWPADLPIVDPHHHLWDLEKNSYPWLQQEPPPELVCGDIRAIRRSYLVDHLKADIGALPVVKSVHLQCDWNPSDPCGETRWLETQSERFGLPTGIVAFAALQGEDVEHVLDGHLAASPRMRGIRQILNWHADSVLTFGAPKGLMTTSAWRRGFAALANRGLSFDLQIYPHQMDEAATLAADFPDVAIVVNHGGMPVDRTAEGMRQWKDGLRLLASRENVAMKISGLGMVDHSWTITSIRGLVLELIDAFGTERCMFASNFPVDRLYSSYAAIWHAFLDITAGFGDAERRALFSGNAERVYRL